MKNEEYQLVHEEKKHAIISISSYIAIFYLISAFIATLTVNFATSYYDTTIEQLQHFLSTIDKLDLNSFVFTPVSMTYLMYNALTNLTTYIVLIITLLLINFQYLINAIKDFFKNFVKYTTYGFLSFVIYYIASIIISLLIQSLKIESSAQNQVLLELMIKNGFLIITFISAVVIGPLVEELIFRKSIFNLIQNDKIAIVVSSLVFGAIHLLSSIGSGYSFLEIIILTIPYILFGFIFAILYVKCNKNILPSTAVHIIINALSVFIIYFS